MMISLILALVAPAHAQTFTDAQVPDLNAQYFRPSVDATRTFWTDESSVPEAFFAPKLLLHYTDEPLIYTYDSGAEVPVVYGVAQADLMAAASYERFRFGVVVPIYLVADGAVASAETGLGDLALDGKVNLLDEWEDAVGVAVAGRVFLPTATVDNALGAPNVGWELSGIVDKRVLEDDLLLAANVGIRGGPRNELENVVLDDYLTWRAGAAYDATSWMAFSGELLGSYNLPGDEEQASLPMEAMLGAHLMSKDVNVRLGAGTGLTGGIGAPDWRVVLGVDFPLADPDPDTDGDGVADSIDSCPNEPEDVDTVLDDDGCPDAPTPVVVKVVDPDGNVVEGASVELSAEGPYEPGDYLATATADGYRPAEAAFSVAPVEGEKTVTVTLEPIVGTLSVTVIDADENPLDARILVNGEPMAKAAAWSGGVAPGEVTVVARLKHYKPAKTVAAVVSDAQTDVVLMLEASKADLEGDHIDLADSVYFDTAKATIQERSFPLLKDVVDILNDHPELTKIRIEGHTDSRGSASYNKDLSQRRADSVRQHLIGLGIPSERLSAVGWGEEKPLDPAETPEAWEKNRRVDFWVEERSDGVPTRD